MNFASSLHICVFLDSDRVWIMDSDDELLITKLQTESTQVESELVDANEDIVKLEVVDEEEDSGNNFQVRQKN